MLICSVILVGFALADFNSAVRPFSLFHMEEGKEKAEQTISDHGKRTAQSLDADQSETEVLWQNIKRSKPGMARSMAFFWHVFLPSVVSFSGSACFGLTCVFTVPMSFIWHDFGAN